MLKIKPTKVNIRFENEKPVCVCLIDSKQEKKCHNDSCEFGTLEWDRFKGWKESFYTNRYGKGRT